MCCSHRREDGSSVTRLVDFRVSLGNMECRCCSHGSMTPHVRNECDGEMSFFVLKFCDSNGHVQPAASVRPCGKKHEIQTEVLSENESSVNVCPVVEDEMEEVVMDDKEEPSEESRVVRGGTTEDSYADIERTTRARKNTHSSSKLVQALCRCTGKQSCSSRS